MPKGSIYCRDFIRMTYRERALKQVEKNRELFAERQKLVDAGKARWVKIPILNGFKIHFELINDETQ
jgi:hypothetical protein